MHAFRDDALSDLDAVALVDSIRTGRVSRPELIEAAIARVEVVNSSTGWPTKRSIGHLRVPTRALPDPATSMVCRRSSGQRGRRRHADHAGDRRMGAAAVGHQR